MREFFEHVPEGAKAVIDWMSWFTVMATISKFLPAIAAVFSISWSCLRIYESKTVQTWLRIRKGVGK